ncbi:MAG: EexN family lipoprotein [Burkholderiaceae bacterium]|jgi:hypothetical protein|nr:EexN family lipoprotein [Burkholderiaceae bacterium]
MNKTRRTSIAALGFASMLAILAGCSKSEHSVEWYMEHKAEREEKVKWCNDDMSRATDVDCLNASKAKERAMLQGPSAADSFKFNPAAVPQGNGAGSSPASAPAPAAPAKSQKSAADSFHFDPNKVPKGGK